MKNTIKKSIGLFLSKALDPIGYKISKKRTAYFYGQFSTAFECSLIALLSTIEELKIVQVGANDGVTNDPIYNFVKAFHTRTKILLIEPQDFLIPFLRENYSFHEKSTVYKGAIGENGELRLYSIDKSYWTKINPDYAKDWPEYRAPTGVTSFDKGHVENWLKKNGSMIVDKEKAIRETIVPCRQLSTLLHELDFSNNIDVLQVDAEGYDDQVIYNSNIDKYLPKIINFEAKNLPIEKFTSLRQYLEKCGYIITCHGGDALAILSKYSSNKL